MKLPELSIRQVGDLIFLSAGVVGASALYEQYFVHHTVTIASVIGLFTVLLAVSTIFYLYYEKTPIDSVMEMIG